MLLFTVVIALVLLSYFVQQNRNSSDMDDFRREHLSRLDQMELRLTETEEALTGLEERIIVLESRQENLDKAISGVQAKETEDYKALVTEQKAQRTELEALRDALNEELEKTGR